MTQRHDQTELDAAAWLYWIEEATDHAVRDHFCDDPAALEQVLAYRGDRARISGLRAPSPPAGLLDAAIAEAMSPVAIASPGAARRTRRRAQRWRDLPRNASMAAALLIGVGVVWFAITELVDRIDHVAVDESSPPLARHEIPRADNPQPARPFYDLAAAVAQRQMSQSPTQPETAETMAPVQAPFALVLGATDQASVEWALCAVSQSLASDATVVRNLSTLEVEHLYGQALASWRQRPERTSPLVASDQSARPGSSVPYARGGKSRGAETAPSAVMPSGVLAGSPDLAPSFQEQLRTSDLGAQVTVVLRARDLSAMIAGLSLFEESVALVVLPESSDPQVPLREVSIKTALSELAGAVEDDVLVHLPVIRR